MELPPLPEPAGAIDIDEGPAGDGLPAGARLQSSADGYTADQMRSYALEAVEAERERCARICEWRATNAFIEQETEALACAAAIRGEKL